MLTASMVNNNNNNLTCSKNSANKISIVDRSAAAAAAVSLKNYRVAQENGQRIFGPPLDCQDDLVIPEKGTEVFVGKIPRDCFEDELIPVFEKAGRIYKMRLMIDFSCKNRGYGFVQYFNKTDAKRAVQMLNNYPIRKKWPIGVMLSKNNNRLFFGNLPNNITKQDMINEVSKHTAGIKSVIYYGGQHRPNGFGFVEYENHKMTALARRKFFPGSVLLFGRQPKVDWAKSDEDVDDDQPSPSQQRNNQHHNQQSQSSSPLSTGSPGNGKKCVLYVRFFKPNCTEEQLKQFFTVQQQKPGKNIQVVKVKMIRNFAFIYYDNHHDAQLAYEHFQSLDLGKTSISDEDQELEIKWAKNKPHTPASTNTTSMINHHSPPSKSIAKCKEFQLVNQNQPQQQQIQQPINLNPIQPQQLPVQSQILNLFGFNGNNHLANNYNPFHIL